MVANFAPPVALATIFPVLIDFEAFAFSLFRAVLVPILAQIPVLGLSASAAIPVFSSASMKIAKFFPLALFFLLRATPARPLPATRWRKRCLEEENKKARWISMSSNLVDQREVRDWSESGQRVVRDDLYEGRQVDSSSLLCQI